MIKLQKKIAGLPQREKRLLLQAFWVSLQACCIISLLPMKWYQQKWLGQQVTDPAYKLLPVSPDEDRLKLVASAVRRCSRHAPWNTKCLVQAITAKRLLRNEHIDSMLVLGVAKHSDTDLSAHAWLKVGDRIITGKKGMQKFTVVSKFV